VCSPLSSADSKRRTAPTSTRRGLDYLPKFDVSEKANAPSAGGGVNGDVESLDYTVGLASSAGGSGLM